MAEKVLLDYYENCAKCIAGIATSHTHGPGGSISYTTGACPNENCVDGWVPHAKLDVTDITDTLADILNKLADIKEKLDET